MKTFNKDNNKEEHEIDEKLQRCLLQKQTKRQRALENWNWDQVIDVVSSENEGLTPSAVDTSDTADSTLVKKN